MSARAYRLAERLIVAGACVVLVLFYTGWPR
jgi:hypothetical protein